MPHFSCFRVVPFCVFFIQWDEIRRIELEQLSATLKENGITADDISAAIADGTIIKKKTVAEEVTDADEKNGATYITSEEKAVEE